VRASDVISAIDLPPGAVISRRVPKATFLAEVKLSAADKSLISDGIEELRWEASLKEATSGIAAYSDDQQDYSEIVVLSTRLRSGAKAGRLLLLIQRAVPYHALLIAEQGQERSDGEQNSMVTVSLAAKRRSQAENEAFVIDSEPTEITLIKDDLPGLRTAFLDSLALSHQPRHSLRELYIGWAESVDAFRAARATGTFALPTSADQARARHSDLGEYDRIEAELTRLRRQLAKEAQMRRKVELNARIKWLRSEYASVRDRL
jgi:hypothetical protein